MSYCESSHLLRSLNLGMLLPNKTVDSLLYCSTCCAELLRAALSRSFLEPPHTTWRNVLKKNLWVVEYSLSRRVLLDGVRKLS